MDKQVKATKKIIEKAVAPFGCKVIEMQKGKKHYKAVVSDGTTCRKLTVSSSASDWRAAKNIAATAKRLAREITEK